MSTSVKHRMESPATSGRRIHGATYLDLLSAGVVVLVTLATLVVGAINLFT